MNKYQTAILTFDNINVILIIQGVIRMKEFNITNYTMVYKTKIEEDDDIFKRFLSFINNKKNIEMLFFFNDEYEIAPADLFTRLNKDLFDPIKNEFINDKGAKQKLGTYFGYLFQFMYSDRYIKGKKIQKRYNEKEMYVLNSASCFFKVENEKN